VRNLERCSDMLGALEKVLNGAWNTAEHMKPFISKDFNRNPR
jgi:hypothetical protein